MDGLVHRILPALEPRRGTLVFLHGMGSSLEGWTFLQPVLDLPWLELVVVQATLPCGKGWRWYEVDETNLSLPQTRDQITAHLALLENFLLSLDRPPRSLVVGGFSQGSVLSLELGLRSGIELGGLLCISGYVPLVDDHPAASGPLATSRQILCTHGQWDDVVPLEYARSQYRTLASKGVPIEAEVFDKDHGFDPCDERRRIRDWLAGRLG